MQGGETTAEQELVRLREENLLLLERVSCLTRLQAELAETRHHLDQSTRRFRRMQDFMRAAVKTESRSELASRTCEAVVDILECELGLLWCLRCPQGRDSLYVSPGPGPSAAAVDDLASWAASWTGGRFPDHDHPLPESLNVRDHLVAPILDDEGVINGILIAANTNGRADIHDRFDESAARSFATFAGQVGAIMESRRRRELINGQIETIRRSEERLTLALEGSNVGLWDWEFRSSRVYYSEQWKNQLGHSGDEISDALSEWSDRLHPEDRADALSKAFTFFQSGIRSYSSTFRLRHRDGEWRWIVAKGFIVRDAEDKPCRAVGTHIDITAYKKLEERLRAAKEQAERANRAKSDFLAKISHEIRTPLNGMIGTLQLLRETEIDAGQRKLVELGEKSGRWIIEIIGESLDLARIEAGKLVLNSNPFDPRLLIADVMDIKRSKASAKGLRIRCVISRDLPGMILGDAGRFRQIITNLVGNAIKFTRRGGLTVGLRLARPTSDIDLPRIELVVSDSGVGIPEELAETVFQPFQQIHTSPGNLSEGIGLGLAITRELVSLMKGSLGVARRRHGGSRFVVTLPLQRAPADPVAPTVGGPPHRRFKGSVLLVEDDPISREIATLMIQRRGLTVDTAADGEEGLRRLLSGHYDLAFVDCWMPQLDGLRMTRRFREQADPASRDMPVIALTANTQAADIDASRAAGMNYYLTKPLMDDALLDCLNRFAPPDPEPASRPQT